MRTKFEIKKTILINDLFVSENWISNGVFAIRKLFVTNSDDFHSEKIYNRLSIYKGVGADFSKQDDDFEQWIKKDFNNLYVKTNVCIREMKKYFTVFECKETEEQYRYILIDNDYIDYFNLEKLYGDVKNDSIVFVDNPEQIDFFVCDSELKYDSSVIQKMIRFGNGNSDSKMNKFFK
jgi:hypothetical protein